MILTTLQNKEFSVLEEQLMRTARHLRQIVLKRPPETVPTITLSGEIFVRRDALSRQYITERLAEKGFATSCSPVAEWVLYCNYMVDAGLSAESMTMKEKLKFKIRNKFQARYEKRIKSILSESGLVHAEPVDIDTFINNASSYISKNLPGEAVLTVGGLPDRNCFPFLRRHRHRSVWLHAQPVVGGHFKRNHDQQRKAGYRTAKPTTQGGSCRCRRPSISGNRKRRLPFSRNSLTPSWKRSACGLNDCINA